MNSITYPKGYKANGIHCGLRRNTSRYDLGIIVSDKIANVAALYTQNKIKGAPLIVCKEYLINNKARAIICNSGIANTCSENGIELAKEITSNTAKILNEIPSNILVASTGLIGSVLPVDLINNQLGNLITKTSIDNGCRFIKAIQTTDTIDKECHTNFFLNNIECRIGACAKGSGMVNPNMATVLCFITSDICIEEIALQSVLKEVCDETFNMLNIDNQTSTNDMVVMMANGSAGNTMIEANTEEYLILKDSLFKIMLDLTRKVAFDGEGATKLIKVNVKNANLLEDARAMAKNIVSSDLVKCAIFASDVNWGRIIVAIGNSGVNLDTYSIDVSIKSNIGIVKLCHNLEGITFDEILASKILDEKEIEIIVDLKQGKHNAISYGCDLSYEYININTKYRKEALIDNG